VMVSWMVSETIHSAGESGTVDAGLSGASSVTSLEQAG
jgi:hypothetical protein